MAGEKHLLLSILGDYDTAGLESEIWQTDLRLSLVFGDTDPVGTLPSNWDPVAHTIARVETDWTIEGNWNVEGPGTSVFQPDDYLNDQAAPAVAAWMALNLCSDQVRVRQLKLSPIGAPTGNLVPAPPYSTGSPCVLTWTGTPPTGSASGTPLPLQNSAVVSHKGAQVGPRGRGRMFLPVLTSAALSSMKLQNAKQINLRDAHVAFLEAVAYSAIGVGGDTVRPIVTGKPFTQYSVVQQVRVGNIVDTQRRRRNRLREAYETGNPSY